MPANNKYLPAKRVDIYLSINGLLLRLTKIINDRHFIKYIVKSLVKQKKRTFLCGFYVEEVL